MRRNPLATGLSSNISLAKSRLTKFDNLMFYPQNCFLLISIDDLFVGLQIKQALPEPRRVRTQNYAMVGCVGIK